MSANWYDVLGVERTASAEGIRAAWKDSIADLEPADRRFKVYNEAAGVLLDVDRRAAYDDTLEPEESDGNESRADDARESVAGPVRSGPAVATWLLIALLVAVVAAAGGAAWLHHDNDRPDSESNISAARTAAEDSVPQVLTYDYRYPDRDHDRAMRLVTGDFRTEYDAIWNDAILPNLEKTKATAVSTALGSGAVRASENGERVEVVVVLQSRTTNRNVSSSLPPLPMTVQMVERNGQWLIADLDLWEPKQAGDGDNGESGTNPKKP